MLLKIFNVALVGAVYSDIPELGSILRCYVQENTEDRAMSAFQRYSTQESILFVYSQQQQNHLP
jgi:hypothetical protein